MQRLFPRSMLYSIAMLVMLGAVPKLARAEIGIWTSAAELATIPKSGSGWSELLEAAASDCSHPDVQNQNDNTNVNVLAASIVYARTGDLAMRDKVVAACETLVVHGFPGGTSLAWARETGTYAMAADLAGYRTAAFEAWLRAAAETWIDPEGLTLRAMFERKPNNWGSHAFASLAAIYRYLGDDASLRAIRDYWIRGVTGPNPGYHYNHDLSWQANPDDPRLIAPVNTVLDSLDLDGVIPEEMRRGGPRQRPPLPTQYPWEFLQGQIMAARILERAHLSIWWAGNWALYRAVYAMQVRYQNAFGGWAASGDDLWVLPFVDKVYGTRWTRTGGGRLREWEAGKNAGWAYVTRAREFGVRVRTFGNGTVTYAPWRDTYPWGAGVTLTAWPGAGWVFAGWSGDIADSALSVSLDVRGNKRIEARFAKIGRAAAKMEPLDTKATERVQLWNAEPNPCRAATVVRYSLPRAGHVRLEIFDARGRKIATLADGMETAGAHVREWRARDAAGRTVPNGLYFYRLHAEGRTITRKLLKTG